MRRPRFGHGLGTSWEANANFGGIDQLSHNLVAEVLQEIGFVGLILFGMLLASIGSSTRRALAALRQSPDASPVLLSLGHAMQAWFITNLFCSLFTYGLSNYNWYLLAGLADVLTAQLAKLPHAAADSARPSAATAGLRVPSTGRLPELGARA